MKGNKPACFKKSVAINRIVHQSCRYEETNEKMELSKFLVLPCKSHLPDLLC